MVAVEVSNEQPVTVTLTLYELMLLVGSLNQNITDFKADKTITGAGILQLNMLAKKLEEILNSHNIS